MSTEPALLNAPKPLPAFGGLTLKQSAFLDNFLSNSDTLGNATKSVIAAGYTADTASAAVIGSQLLRSLKIKQEIKRRLGTAVASASEVLERLTDHARGDLTDVLRPDGSFDLRYARKRGSSKLLKKLKVKRRIEHDKEGNVTEHIDHEYEIHDPQAALEKLGRWHKLFTDRVETEVELDVSSLAALLRAVCERARQLQVDQAGQLDHVGQVAAIGDGHSESSAVIDVVAMGHVDQTTQLPVSVASGLSGPTPIVTSGSGQSSSPVIATTSDSSRPAPATKPRYHT